MTPTLGIPATVCTNASRAAGIDLVTRVRLAAGAVTLTAGGGAFKVWLDRSNQGRPPLLLVDGETRPTVTMSLAKWRALARLTGEENEARTRILLTSTTPGSRTLTFAFSAGGALNDPVTQRITFVTPPLLPDYNRDGVIDERDVAAYLAGHVFRYWVNECKISGDVWEELSLGQGIADAITGLDNWRDEYVNGRFDLINLFPVALKLEPFLNAWSGHGAVGVRIRSVDGNGRFNYTLASIGHSEAGTIRTAPRVNTLGAPLAGARLAALDGSGLALSATQIADMFSENSALLVCEAKSPSWFGLELSVTVGGEDMYTFRLPMRMSTVDDMYRYVDIRGAHENPAMEFAGTDAPPNNAEAEAYGRDVFFVHGFNVSPANAREWNREMFKRFWVSGMKARYWGVTWSGDYHVTPLVGDWFNGLHYHRDVRQALLTAPTFKRLVDIHGRNAVVIGHSLGNMVVSEALLLGANASTYIMLDAAVASEAYRPELQADSDEILAKYRPGDWNGYDSLAWSANWYTWFTNDVNDARGKIGWAGHFAPLLNRQGLSVYNFYSSGDEVFDEADGTPGISTGVFHWPTLNLEWPFFHLNWTLDAFPWQKQEVFKGVNAAGSLSAGWGFHCWVTNVNGEAVWVKYSAEGANTIVANGSIVTNAVFDRGVSAMFNSTISDYDKADILAFHIPAVSSPAGKVAVFGNNDAVDMNASCKVNHWGREGVQVENEAGQLVTVYPWLHSDIKNMAYYHVYPAFTNLIQKGDLK